jgi:hypothetical protein
MGEPLDVATHLQAPVLLTRFAERCNSCTNQSGLDIGRTYDQKTERDRSNRRSEGWGSGEGSRL